MRRSALFGQVDFRLLRLTRLGLACATICVTGLAAAAQEGGVPQAPTVAALVGAQDISGAFRGKFTRGLSFGAAFQVGTPMSRIAVRGDAMYYWLGEKVCDIVGSTCVNQYASTHLIAWSIDAIARLNDPSARWSPYLIVGGATYTFGDFAYPIKSLKPSHTGFQAGVGFEVRNEVGKTFVEVRHLDMAPGGITVVTLGRRISLK